MVRVKLKHTQGHRYIIFVCQTGLLDDMMMSAIQLNRVDFVDLFLDNGVSLKDFLTIKRLLKLYNDVSLCVCVYVCVHACVCVCVCVRVCVCECGLASGQQVTKLEGVYWNDCVCLSVHVSGFVQKISSELLNLL